jgi:hypothetical protein
MSMCDVREGLLGGQTHTGPYLMNGKSSFGALLKPGLHRLVQMPLTPYLTSSEGGT